MLVIQDAFPRWKRRNICGPSLEMFMETLWVEESQASHAEQEICEIQSLGARWTLLCVVFRGQLCMDTEVKWEVETAGPKGHRAGVWNLTATRVLQEEEEDHCAV